MKISRLVAPLCALAILASLLLAWLRSPTWLLLAAAVVPLVLMLRRAGGNAGGVASGGGQVSLVEPDEAIDWVKQGKATVIDVREPAEYAAGHIPGALLLPLSRFDPRRVPVEPGKKLVFHCQSGMRCGPASAKMLASGFDGQIHRLHGGFKAWRQAGGMVTTGP